MREIIKAENIKTMTSTELSNLLGKEKKEVNKAVRLLFADKIAGGFFSLTRRANGQVDEYYLPELESKMFVAKQDINYLEKITQFWIDQNNVPALPNLNDPKVLTGLLLENLEKVKQLESTNTAQSEKIIHDKPLVEFAKTVEGTDKSISIGALAKLSGLIGRNTLFKRLRDDKILIPYGREKNKPFQTYMDRGYFEVSETIVKRTSGDQITFTTSVTGKGQLWIMDKIRFWIKSNHGQL